MALSNSPTLPGGGTNSKNGGPTLDAPPPLPPGMKTPDYSTLAGNYNQGGAPPTGELAGMVLQQAMLLEKVSMSLAKMLPAFAPMAAQIVQLMRAGIVQALQMSQQGSGQVPMAMAGGAPPTGGGMGMGGNMMNPGPVPSGAAGPPPGTMA